VTEQSSVAVVTGGSRGIGLELCRQLAAERLTVVLGSRDLQRGEVAAASLGDAGVQLVRLDVDDDASVAAAAEWVSQRLGRCDVLINNAAIDYDSDARAGSADLARVHRILETNLLGAWRTCLAFLPLLRRSPHGRIVNVSSEAGSLARMGVDAPGYRVSKAALNALTRTLAGDLKSTGILVNAVTPGWTDTDMGRAWRPVLDGGASGGRPVRDGAASIMWAVHLPDDGPTGGFFLDGRPLAW
jgi:NAD(P)-dependent dehydrogenase (short-subunit alcohol dehydrogenase family)